MGGAVVAVDVVVVTDVVVVPVVVDVAVTVVVELVAVVVVLEVSVTVVDVHASHVTGHLATISANAHAEAGMVLHSASCGWP